MENSQTPSLTEQIPDLNTFQEKITPVDYVYNSIKSKAPSLLSKIDSVKNDADYFTDIFNSASEPKKFSFNEDTININEAYTKLSDGTFVTRYDEGFIKGADNEELYAQKQSKTSKWANGLSKFGLKTANNVVGGTLGTVYGAISAISEGNWEKVYDNEFYDFLDDQNTKLDNFVANYRTQEERDLGFFGSMTKANFWADDFLGGMSFLTGTVISESLWAAATGGASLSTTAARAGLRGSKYFNVAKKLTKGIKQAQKTAQKYNRVSSIQKAASTAKKYGKAGEVLNTARFTYTGAGFEAGMEARLYQKEQRENFYRDFEFLNGREPSAQEIADFEDDLGNTTNTLWAANMALVGTSNLAVLGKAFGVSSPFKTSTKTLDKILFGKGVKSTFGEAGERVSTEALKRTKLQKGLGITKSLLKGPFYEGFVEEGGQSTFSSAMENYITSRYDPSKDAIGLIESMYEGLSHTYGTKEGWKEVGLGALIGLVGGEGSNILSGEKIFSEARESLKDQDSESKIKAELQDKNKGTNTVKRIFATKFEEDLRQATEIQNAEADFEKAQQKGDVMGMATSQTRVLLSSVASAVNMDYLDEQVSDFEAALKMQDKKEIAEHYDINEDEVDDKIQKLVLEYKKIGEDYKSAKDFADYMISDNPKELFEDATDVDVQDARAAIAYQMVMTDSIEKTTEESFNSLKTSLSELSPKIASKYTQALTRFNQINKSKKKDVIELGKIENKLKLKKNQLNSLNNKLLKINQTKVEGNSTKEQKNSNQYNNLVNKMSEVESDIEKLNLDLNEKNSKLEGLKGEMSDLNLSSRALANQLDSIDPFAGEDLVDQISLEETQKQLEELEKTLKEAGKTNPRLTERIIKLGEEYRKGISLWKRNSETIQDLTDPDLGLDRIGTMFQKKKQAGTTAISLLKKLQETQLEELAFNDKISNLVKGEVKNDTSVEGKNEESEQKKADENRGDDPLKDSTQNQTPVEAKISELKSTLKELIGKNSFLLDNFSENGERLLDEKAPTQEDLNEYQNLRKSFKSGDINKLLGRPVEQISKKIKEKSGLNDEQIKRYQALSQKMVDWRVVTGTNFEGISVQDILDQIEAYEKNLINKEDQITTEQVIEITEKAEKDFGLDKGDPDFVNTMDKVNIHRDSIQTTISHLKMSTVENSDFKVTYLKDVNRGTEEEPDLAATYLLEKGKESFEIHYTNDHHRIIVSKENTQAFLDGMGIQTVKYNNKTGWGYVFKDGKPMKSDFGINLINNPNVNILNPQLIYELKPGDKVSFVVDTKDVYNNDDILPLIENGKLEEAKKLMSVYIVDQNNSVLGFLKSGAKAKGSNFNKIRDEAFKILQNNILNDNTNSIFNLPFEVEVEKTFIGSPNIELDNDGNVKRYPISEAQSKKIVGFGYVNEGVLEENEDVRKTFIPKDKSTPYVIILHGQTKIAFPVAMSLVTSNVKNQVKEILDSDIREQKKITDIIGLLKQNGIEPAEFNIGGLKDNSIELEKLFKTLDDSKRSYTKEEIESLTKEEFLKASEIIIDLDKLAFVSPKLKISLSKKLINTKTKEKTKSKPVSNSKRQDLLINHLIHLAKANNEEEVLNLVQQTGDELLIKEFLENSKFKSQVIKAALDKKTVPSINTSFTLEELLKDLIDTDSENIPLNILEDFLSELDDLKSNPSLEKIKNLAEKIKNSLENEHELVDSEIDTNNLYHISTTETEEQMFKQGYVKVFNDFYKKVDLKYTNEELIKGLFEKYKEGTLPTHMSISENLSFDEFENEMPNTLLDTYKFYYNSQPILIPSKKASIVGNDQYLREEFKGDFAKFIKEEKKKGSLLYKEVLKHLKISVKGILKNNLLTRDKIDSFKKELGPNYSNLLNYSLINKHIELDETPQSIIFVEDVEKRNRIEAVNNSNLPRPRSKATIIDEQTISFSKVNDDFIQYEKNVYEKVYSSNQGQYVYQRISKIDPDFIITEVVPPFDTSSINTSSEIDDTKTTVKTTEKRGDLDC